MTQDCLDSPSTADVSKHLPKGIHVTGADDKSDPAIEGMPWGYLFFHNKTARAFEKEKKDRNDQNNSVIPCFIIYSSFASSEVKGVKGVIAPYGRRVVKTIVFLA